MAAILGVSKHTLRSWEDHARQPSASARKLIWIVHALFHKVELLSDLDTLVSWGQGTAPETPTPDALDDVLVHPAPIGSAH